ncbi:MAG: hypothetical protein ACTJLK_03535 [Anaplasma sp.]
MTHNDMLEEDKGDYSVSQDQPLTSGVAFAAHLHADEEQHQDHLAELRHQIDFLHKQLVHLEQVVLVERRAEQREALRNYVKHLRARSGMVCSIFLVLSAALFLTSILILTKHVKILSKTIFTGLMPGIVALYSRPYPMELKVAATLVAPLLLCTVILGFSLLFHGWRKDRIHAVLISDLVEKYEACQEVERSVSETRAALQSAVVYAVNSGTGELQWLKQGILLCMGDLDALCKFRECLDVEVAKIRDSIAHIDGKMQLQVRDALEWNFQRTTRALDDTEKRLQALSNQVAGYLDDTMMTLDETRRLADSSAVRVDNSVQEQLSGVLTQIGQIKTSFGSLQKSVSETLQAGVNTTRKAIYDALDERMSGLKVVSDLLSQGQNSVVTVCNMLSEAEVALNGCLSVKRSSRWKLCSAPQHPSLEYTYTTPEGKTNTVSVRNKISEVAALVLRAIANLRAYEKAHGHYDRSQEAYWVHCRDVLRQLDRGLFYGGGGIVFHNAEEYRLFARKVEVAADEDAVPDEIRPALRSFAQAASGLLLELPCYIAVALATDEIRTSIDGMIEACKRILTRVPQSQEQERGEASVPPAHVVESVVAERVVPSTRKVVMTASASG